MSRFFINRPVTAIVISILIVIVAIVLAQRLPIAQFPDIAPPEIVVTTNYVGADLSINPWNINTNRRSKSILGIGTCHVFFSSHGCAT